MEKILKHRKRKGEMEYLVKWQGYGDKDICWEPVVNLECRDLIAAYNKKQNIVLSSESVSFLPTRRYHYYSAVACVINIVYHKTLLYLSNLTRFFETDLSLSASLAAARGGGREAESNWSQKTDQLMKSIDVFFFKRIIHGILYGRDIYIFCRVADLDPLHLAGSGSTSIPDPDSLWFLFPDPDPLK